MGCVFDIVMRTLKADTGNLHMLPNQDGADIPDPEIAYTDG